MAQSILSAAFARLGDEVRAVEAAGADYLRLGVMDGRFVPNITIGPVVVEAVRKSTHLPLDVHLMIVEPEKYLRDFAKAGAHFLTVPVEVAPHFHRVLQQIRDLGAPPSVVLNPSTPLSSIEHLLADVEMILLMTVNPGLRAQRFIPHTAPTVR